MRVNRRRGQILTVMVSVAAIASFGSVVWWAHNQDVKAGGKGLEPLVVQAPPTPSRIKPDNAGGLVPPNQDKEVFNRIAPGDRRSEVVSSYMIALFAGNSVPVIGIGFLAAAATALTAHAVFAAVLSVLATLALLTGLNSRRRSEQAAQHESVVRSDIAVRYLFAHDLYPKTGARFSGSCAT